MVINGQCIRNGLTSIMNLHVLKLLQLHLSYIVIIIFLVLMLLLALMDRLKYMLLLNGPINFHEFIYVCFIKNLNLIFRPKRHR